MTILPDGAASFTWLGGTPVFGVVDFSVDGGATDNMSETWWFYRVSGDSSETVLPAPDSQSYVGNTATFGWTDVDARGLFSAAMVGRVIDDGGSSGRVALQLTITNISGASLELEIFSYADFGLGGSAGDDSATLLNDPDYMSITDGGSAVTAEFRCLGADELQVTSFPTLRSSLLDASVDDLDGTGLPFGPGDWTGAYQFGVVILAGGSTTLVDDLAINATVPVELRSFTVE